MTHSQPQKLPVVTDQWTEIIDLWMHLPYFHNLYDEKCLKFDCVKLQYGDQEESHNDSETWPHQNILDKEDAPEEVDEVKEKGKLAILPRSFSQNRHSKLFYNDCIHHNCFQHYYSYNTSEI